MSDIDAVEHRIKGGDAHGLQVNPEEKIWKGEFTFIQGADTQFGMIDSYLLKLKEPKWDKEIALTKQCIQMINKMKPKPRFFVICGDLLDSFPFEEKGQLELRKLQYKDFLEVFKELDPEIKLLCVCGNHDIGNDPTYETIQNYRKEFGSDYYSFWCGGVKFVVLNSQYFKSGDNVPEVKKHYDFMKSIPDSTAKHIVVFQHIPFFLNNPNEDDNYFSIEKELRNKLLKELYDYGVRSIFCGHFHRNAGGYYEGMEEVVTSAIGAQLGDDKSGFRIVNVSDTKIFHKYVEISQ